MSFDRYSMDVVCAQCGRPFGDHIGMECPRPYRTQFSPRDTTTTLDTEPKMKLTNIPEYINCKDIEIAWAIALLLQQQGYMINSNIGFTQGVKENVTDGTCLSTRDKRVARYSDNHTSKPGPVFSSLLDFITHCTPPEIRIGSYAAEIKPKGVQVGCTFVPWETVEQLLAQRKAL